VAPDDNGNGGSGFGIRRAAYNRIFEADDHLLAFGGPFGVFNQCRGDSGGPTILSIGGVRTIIATSSAGNNNCQSSIDVRTDAEAEFISAQIRAADPDSAH
jgi:hypothetical protein